jgi:hypothetical protein
MNADVTAMKALVQAISDPAQAGHLSAQNWTDLYREARTTGLLGRLAHRMGQLPDHEQNCPLALKAHFEAAIRLSIAQSREVLREARYIDHALSGLGAPVVLLKGAAYAVAGLPPAQGRVFSDVDIMVPKSHLAQAESHLTMNGWMTTETSVYNQRYYRQWMHELPPMQHVHRSTVLDVHHAILPQTARLRPPAALLFGSAVPIAGTQTLHVLAPADMVLHSLTHLFVNDDMTNAWRDLSDLDLLVRYFGEQPTFWQTLVPRSRQLDLHRPLFYALTQLRRVWRTPIPGPVWEEAQADGPRGLSGPVMRAVWDRVFDTDHVESAQAGRAIALAALYLRGHWLRMPVPLLARHLTVKALGLHEPAQKKPAAPPTPTG